MANLRVFRVQFATVDGTRINVSTSRLVKKKKKCTHVIIEFKFFPV